MAQATSKSVDVVAVLKQTDLTQVFAKARPLNATVMEGGMIPKHPLEDGSNTTDHLVQNLIEITLPVMIGGDDVKPTIEEIRNLYKAGTLLIVQTRAGSYKSMVLFDMPHEENAEAFDAVTMTLKLSEFRFVKPTQGGTVPKAKKHGKTTSRGKVQTKATAEKPRGSFLYRHLKVF